MSPSSRRAGIEILHGGQLLRRDLVALLAEGGDRNVLKAVDSHHQSSSPSSRRAGIEISQIRRSAPHTSGRPPRGGRG